MSTIREQWSSKLTTAEGIAEQVKSGWVCCTDIAAGTPYALLKTVGEYIKKNGICDVTLHTILDVASIPCYQEELHGNISGISWFSGVNARKAVNQGYGDVMPCYYRDMPKLFTDRPKMDAVFLEVAPMDEEGYFSIGITCSNIPAMLKNSARVFLEVNEFMPRSIHAPAVHISAVTAFCIRNAQLPTAKKAKPDAISTKIGELIAEEIPNGATIQLGIGAIPDAVGRALQNKAGLGIHTEMFTDSMVSLIKSGVVTNMNKPIHTGRSVATFAFGSQEMYDFIHENELIEFLPVDYTNNPQIIAAHPNFISINAALAVDFYGQVCAESLGSKHISGTGGQVDFVRGAVESKGGKSFIAFPSTAGGGTISRICSVLPEGSIVTTSKNDVDYIATEYGVAKLRGKTLSQRTEALISIAHPNFREQLLFDAKRMNILI